MERGCEAVRPLIRGAVPGFAPPPPASSSSSSSSSSSTSPSSFPPSSSYAARKQQAGVPLRRPKRRTSCVNQIVKI
eukprot:1933233-Pyramimonas_sp.AAC.1